ncbi:MAG: response regulator [Deltaproteobacteria bacterium]|nr:response regulator [Deltaproteobacteria bacterium]
MADLVIVDDDDDVAALLSEFLSAEGHRCRIAHDGREGLALIHASRPDLILLDVEMPVLNGPDMAYQLLVHDSGLEEIPIVLLSGVVGLPQVAAMVGTPYFLAKPYRIDDALHLVEIGLRERAVPHPSPSVLNP